MYTTWNIIIITQELQTTLHLNLFQPF